MTQLSRTWRTPLVLAVLLLAARGVAQVWENARDPTGILIPYRLVHLVHSRDLALKGATADLRSRDPFLFYQLGRDLVNRQFALKHGIYGQAGSLNVPLYARSSGTALVHGMPARFARDHSSSCGMCHSSLFREPSAGQTIGSTGGMGRNTPHFFGAGIVEMLGEQIRAHALERYDLDRDGVISRAEVAGPCPVEIRPAPDAAPIDYGDLQPGPDGVPQLNSLFRVWYVDASGRIQDAVSFKDPRVAAFGFAVQPFGWGRGYQEIGGARVSEGGEASTLRQFYTVAADFHMGLQAYDPTQQGRDPGASGAGGLAKVSLNGAQQFDFGGSVDPGHKLTPKGLSLDDPDRDGHLNELTEGDVDAVEFFLVHTPQPAVRATESSEEGRAVLLQIGCTRCHVESWRLEARDDSRDRRLFRLETRSRLLPTGVSEIVGRLVRSSRVLPSGERVPLGEATTIERIYSDFKHWDIGPQYYERRFDGTLQKGHRTAPLWGVGGTAPYGHDGRFMSLDEAIRAHGGAAEPEGEAYGALAAANREQLIEYLKSLVLYPTDEIAADINGDGKIDEDHVVNGRRGYECFDARLLFARPPRFKNVGSYTRYDGRQMPLLLIENISAAYGLELPARVDSHGGGFPDILDPPARQGGNNGSKSP
jgi:di-heme oxidoreductase (putative peroxidase)/EF hand domain-containing protein